MEKRLQEYRRLKAEKLGGRDTAAEMSTTSRKTYFAPSLGSDTKDSESKDGQKNDEEKYEKNSNDEQRRFKETLRIIESRQKASLSFWERYSVDNLLKLLLWACLLGFFMQVGFAAVYLLISLFYLMYASMKYRSRRNGPSAYSVFNEGCERIDGTFTAEQFEKQLRHGTMR